MSQTIAIRPKTPSLAASMTSAGPGTLESWLASLSPSEADEFLWSWEFWGRPDQLPPPGDWSTWLILAGRGFGKTRAGAEWVRSLVETESAVRIALVAPTAGDARDVMVEGESGLMAVCPPWNRPKYEPSKRRLTWPNGITATTYSADEPDRLRGPQHTHAWCDEPASWRYPKAFDNLRLGLRLGRAQGIKPRICVTGTPRPVPLLRTILGRRGTVKTGGSTYENAENLAPEFVEEIRETYEGTRLGLQELHAEMLEIAEGAWFSGFSMERHVDLSGELARYKPGLPVHLAIDCGTSRHTGAVFFQVQPVTRYRNQVTVFADYYAVDLFSEANALAIREKAQGVCGGRLDKVRLDPAATAKTGVGPSAMGEYQKVFGVRTVAFWPIHRVVDGLDQIEVLMGGPARESDLLIHPDCVHAIEAFKNYQRAEGPGGEWLTFPKDPQHPHEELMDSLRGGLRDAFPEARKPQPLLRRIPARRAF